MFVISRRPASTDVSVTLNGWESKMYTCANGDRVSPDETRVEVRNETFPVKGEPTTISSNIRICNKCGEEVYDRELDTANLLRAYETYRSIHEIVGRRN